MKRSPETAYRLRASSSSSSNLPQDQDRRRQQNQWNGNLQGATNDSNDYKPSVRIVDGFPVEYSCRDDPRENNIDDNDLVDMELTFDYDIVTSQDADIEGSIRSLEWSLLWNVAQNLGLHNCDFRKQNPSLEEQDNLTRRLTTQNFVVDLSSLEFDSIDNSTDSCIAIEGDTAAESTTCTPVVGRMKAHYTGDEETIRAYLLSNIEMEMNSNRVRIEDVEDCRFVGDRDAWEAANFREGINSKNTGTNLAVVVSVVVGVMVVGLALLVARGRRRRQQLVLDAEDDLPTTIPTVVFQKPLSQSRSSIQSSSSGDTEESLPDRNDNMEERATTTTDEGDEEKGQPFFDVDETPVAEDEVPRDSVDANSPKHTILPEVEPQVGPTQEKLTEETPSQTVPASMEEVPEDKENQTVVAGVPPRPPIFVVPLDEKKAKKEAATKASKTLQPRRKRKKKKKKKQRVLKRVSSRNSIDEMETIQEQDGEGSDGGDDTGSEFGSEYSTDDEDLDPSVLMNINGNGDGGLESSVPSARPVPSPIREEPKIRRLPPPWI